ncbi:MAG: heme a synthase [Frankiaceae bacterium]|jgi:cytochrome c oxidase assembly protein subunit 15|nr:heme a synthase [Frankiaceae bacterium]
MPSPTSRRVSLPALRRLTRATVVALTAIVATGGAVRLTRSGLGCDSWPNCGHADGWHALVEYGNRLAGVAVGLVVVATIVAVHLLPQARRDLRRPAYLLGAGYVAQAVLGALSVVLKLAPLLVMAHFLTSMVLVAVAATLHARTRSAADGPTRLRPELSWLSWGLLAGTAAVIVLGTLTTGTGPHSGANPADPAQRFTFLPLHAITMLHGTAATAVVALAGANVLLLRVVGAPRALRTTARWVVGAVVLQAVIGFTQYALGVPRGLVELHLLGATVLWLAVVGHQVALRRAAVPDPPKLPAPAPAPARV